jgi:aminocarboxymuconate-semialdehyde decarboxylase
VDVHVHHLPAALVEAYGRRSEPPCLVDGRVDMGGGLAYPLFPEMLDASRRLELMDADGIAVSVVSVTPPGVSDAAVARDCNDELAALGDRLPALAMLPAAQPEQAAEELARAVSLGLRGGTLYSNVDGRRLEESVIFDAAEELDVPLVLHPTTLAGLDIRGYALTTTLGFLVETALTTLQLVLGGLFDRHPSLKLVVPHLGSVLPFLLGRIDYEAANVPGGTGALSEPPSEHLRRLYVDSVCAWPPALRLALEVFGEERVLFGSDAPFWRVPDGVETVRAVGAAAEIRHGNADALFRLA